jgi:type I restriction enzyme S subunit
MTNVPEIRFKGYTDAWEQRKLGEVSTKIGSGKTPKGGSAVYLQEGIPLLRSQNIANNQVDFSDAVYISESMDSEMANSRVQENDVLLNITGASIGRSAVYEYAFGANVNQHVCIIRPNTGADANFIQLSLASENGLQQIDNNQAGSGREGINFQQISKISFAFPSKLEQVNIGNFFRALDNTITLHQRKLDGLRELKRGYLQQMFPQAGERVPRVRFAGFSGEWVERRLGDVVERVQGNDGRMDLPTLTISAGNGWLDQRERFSNNIAGKEQENYTLLSKGELSYNKGNSKLASMVLCLN